MTVKNWHSGCEKFLKACKNFGRSMQAFENTQCQLASYVLNKRRKGKNSF